MQQAIIQPGAFDLDPLRDHERALELARRDAAVKKHPSVTIVSLTTSDYQLVIFKRDLQIIHRKSRDRQSDTQRDGT